MERREIVIAIQEYVGKLTDEQKCCNGCPQLKTWRIPEASGKGISSFLEGIHCCDEHEVIWAIRGPIADRPLECILGGEKHVEQITDN